MAQRMIIKAALAVWVGLWLLFSVRPYLKKDLAGEYAVLFSSSLEERRAYVTGPRLYEFIRFCNGSMPPSSTYSIVGLDKEPLDGRRAAYYLYPNIEAGVPDFILVYGLDGFSRDGYGIFKRLDRERYILKRTP
ncbi:MAG: hypothetical protein WC515_07080 [Candidatus Omnitrophota bacterium]